MRNGTFHRTRRPAVGGLALVAILGLLGLAVMVSPPSGIPAPVSSITYDYPFNGKPDHDACIRSTVQTFGPLMKDRWTRAETICGATKELSGRY